MLTRVQLKSDFGTMRAQDRTSYYRHRVIVRITHWVNLVCLVVLLMSGLGIFNGWPALYWGIRTHFDQPLLALYATEDRSGQEIGVTDVLGHKFATIGWLGLSPGADGKPAVRGFPRWATIPGQLSLAISRHWHFFFAWIFVFNGALYVADAVLSGHLWRDLIPSPQDLRGITHTMWDHVRLRFPHGEDARSYNVLQKFSYLIVVFGLGPLVVATGLTMSPWMGAAYPQLLDFFGGRQSARTIHFIVAFAFVSFVLIHILMVLISGAWNRLRSMITGRYQIVGPSDRPRGDDGHAASR